MNRGFLVSLDAILAVFIVVAFILASGFFIQRTQYPAWSEVILESVAFDMLSVGEKQGILDSFVTNHTSAKPLFYLTPRGVCARLNVYDASGEMVSSAGKTGCSRFASSTTSSRRIFLKSNAIYVAEAVVWLQ